MSLEQAIADHAAAIRDLAETLRGMGFNITTAAERPQADAPAKTPASRKAAAAAPAPTPDPAEEIAAAERGEEPALPAIEYSTVAAAVLGLVKAKGKDTAIGVLANFGVGNAKELTVEQYAEALEALTAAAA